MMDLDHPHLMTPEEREFTLKAFEKCMPKFNSKLKCGTVYIFGTEGNMKKVYDML